MAMENDRDEGLKSDTDDREEWLRESIALARRTLNLARRMDRLAKAFDCSKGVQRLRIDQLGELYTSGWHLKDKLAQLLGEWRYYQEFERGDYDDEEEAE